MSFEPVLDTRASKHRAKARVEATCFPSPTRAPLVQEPRRPNMRNIIAALFVLSAQPVLACDGAHGETAWKPLKVPELAAMLKQSGAVVLFDANSDKTRAEEGVIPG